jgi:hypothetical protein
VRRAEGTDRAARDETAINSTVFSVERNDDQDHLAEQSRRETFARRFDAIALYTDQYFSMVNPNIAEI